MRKELPELTSIIRRTFRLNGFVKVLHSTIETINLFNERGYASLMKESLMPGFWALALPLPTPNGNSMAIGIGGSKARIKGRENELAEFVRANIPRHFPLGLS